MGMHLKAIVLVLNKLANAPATLAGLDLLDTFNVSIYIINSPLVIYMILNINLFNYLYSRNTVFKWIKI